MEDDLTLTSGLCCKKCRRPKKEESVAICSASVKQGKGHRSEQGVFPHVLSPRAFIEFAIQDSHLCFKWCVKRRTMVSIHFFANRVNIVFLGKTLIFAKPFSSKHEQAVACLLKQGMAVDLSEQFMRQDLG